MLVLERKCGEAVLIGAEGQVVVTVLGINRKGVRLGVAADRSVLVRRGPKRKRPPVKGGGAT